MMILIAAAAVAAAQPATPAPAGPMAQHDMSMQMGQEMDHKAMDCCKDCCDHMADKDEGHGTEHHGEGDAGHHGR